jgi:hypothetical protein
MTCPWPSNVVPTGSPIGLPNARQIQPFQHETVCYSLLKQSGVSRGCASRSLYRFCTADPANWHFWHFSPLEEPITYVESMD